MFVVLKEKSSQSLNSFQALRDEAIGVPERNQRSVSFGVKKNRRFVSLSHKENL